MKSDCWQSRPCSTIKICKLRKCKNNFKKCFYFNCFYSRACCCSYIQKFVVHGKATVHFNQLRYNVVPFPAYFAFLVGSNAFGLFCFIFFCSKQLQEIKITSDTIQIRIRWVRSSCSALRATSTTHLTICINSSILASYATSGVT